MKEEKWCKNLNIIGKSSVNQTHLEGQIAICKNLELQLLDEFDRGEKVSTLMDIMHSVTGYKVCAVHSPLVSSMAVNLEDIGKEIVRKRLEGTLEFAGLLSMEQDYRILVIVHNASLLSTYKQNQSMFYELVHIFDKYLTEYPNLEIGIENVTPFIYVDNVCYFTNGVFFENVELVEYLRKYLIDYQSRIGTVLDTCHSRTTQRICEAIISGTQMKIPTEEEYYKANALVIKEIHLANVKDKGLNKGEHGILFRPDERAKMREEMEYYKAYNYTCDVTIEIKEDDYVRNANFEANYKMLLEICRELDISVEE